MLADADAQLFRRQLVHQLIDSPPKRPVPDADQRLPASCSLGMPPSVRAMKTTPCT
jgi:hypothetical protein